MTEISLGRIKHPQWLQDVLERKPKVAGYRRSKGIDTDEYDVCMAMARLKCDLVERRVEGKVIYLKLEDRGKA
jgi:hypothetical protein